MKYISTRGGGQPIASTFEEALFSGYASDGGILVPETVPKLTPETLANWKQERLTYPQVVQRIIRLYVPTEEIPDTELAQLVQHTYATKFTQPEILPVTQIVGENGAKVGIAECFHGATKSFKDLALSLVGALVDYYLAKSGRHVVALVGTSGDTGSAAMEAVRDSNHVDIIVLYAGGGKIAPVQELQLKAITSKNIHLFEVDGTSDELDKPIKKCCPSEDVITINSTNWARILIQMAHYVYLYLQGSGAGTGNEKEVHVIVPTGGAGNLVSGLFAYKMGVPLKLHFATNSNKCVDTFLADGILKYSSRVETTPACAMDIGQPYNLERLLYLFSGQDTKFIAGFMRDVESGKEARVPVAMMSSIREVVLGSASVSSPDIYTTMKGCWTKNKYVICPHTACALYYFNQHCATAQSDASGSGSASYYIISTASPSKFPEDAEAAGIPVQDWNGNELLDGLKSAKLAVPRTMWKGENWHKMLLDTINTIKAAKSAD